jgi:hypothetical protein
VAFQPQFKDIPEHLRELADGVPRLQKPVWYAGAVYGRTAKSLEEATSARDSEGHPVDEEQVGLGPAPAEETRTSDQPALADAAELRSGETSGTEHN